MNQRGLARGRDRSRGITRSLSGPSRRVGLGQLVVAGVGIDGRLGHSGLRGADRAIARRALHGHLAPHVLQKLRIGRLNLYQADRCVLADDLAAGRLDRRAPGGVRRSVRVQHYIRPRFASAVGTELIHGYRQRAAERDQSTNNHQPSSHGNPLVAATGTRRA